MARQCVLLPRTLRLAAAIAVAACACFPVPVSGIRKDIGLVAPMMCRSTVQGRHLISDDNGYVCSALSFDPWSHCCPITGPRFSCQGCKHDLQCCNSYEYCVSCCLNPSKTKKEDVLKLKEHTQVSLISAWEDAAIVLQVWNDSRYSAGSSESNSVRFLGINIIVGRPGESCSLVCKAKGQSCVPSRLSALNKCEILGPDQPAEVVDDAPASLV
ncbi:hypothetical protein PR202_gb16215 [Eleusine coracana subsp. coracana]|uniref:SREBP regulating gene protein n=1 Tax=Eleusine coracana subsp. coracana TaxID=191504 RepID=A0AAV5EZN5_ELECO|nr:hypothetical protein PR202_gb16215 [Eleusine coracana subsp. coracana]